MGKADDHSADGCSTHSASATPSSPHVAFSLAIANSGEKGIVGGGGEEQQAGEQNNARRAQSNEERENTISGGCGSVYHPPIT